MNLQVIRDLELLTGPEAAGRLSGTAGAWWAAGYLAGQLAEAGLQPAFREGFFQTVDVPAARLTGPAVLQVGGRDLRHRLDFGESAALSAGGSLTGPLRVAHDGEALDPATLRGAVVLIPERPEGFDLAATAATAADLGVGALLVESGEPAWFHKTVYAGRGRLPVLRIRRSVAAALASQSGLPVRVELPLTAGTQPCQNVVGHRPGPHLHLPTLLLVAHYDHLGDDPRGFRFPGAEDNASGVVTLLSVARNLRNHLPANLLIAFTTGEESGLHGARHLATHLPVPVDAAINLDMVGGETGLRAVRVGHSAPGHWLADLAAAEMVRRGIEPRWVDGRDDSAALLGAGIPTIGLGQERTSPGRSVMHTPSDRSEYLDLPTLLEAADLLESLIIRTAHELLERRAIRA
ncbi:MAG: M20/M25/M40 family metallo-hydrolase [Bacillota bacterium]